MAKYKFDGFTYSQQEIDEKVESLDTTLDEWLSKPSNDDVEVIEDDGAACRASGLALHFQCMCILCGWILFFFLFSSCSPCSLLITATPKVLAQSEQSCLCRPY